MDAPELDVLSLVEQVIEAKKQQLGYDEMHDGDPYLQDMVLHNLGMVSIFGCNKHLNPECNITDIYLVSR